ncbi:MAG: UTP--glucose-1-phosphate uridylyltransferase [Actinomyces sp.]|nr:MAG: UTP--glucose-1-phosphate uridylyltransferase [Actinomyces sp.]
MTAEKSPVRRAVIPAAGLGTRFLPATKAVPKEMLTVVDRPAIQWVVEEAAGAGLDDMLIVTSPAKKAVEDHFDRAPELEAVLEAKARHDLLDAVRHPTGIARFHFTRQGAPLGLGHAVSVARHHVGDETFAVLLPDELLADGGRALSRMIAVAADTGSAVVALREVPRDQISSYGCAVPAGAVSADGVVELAGLVEKPPVDEAPSQLAVMGRYVLPPVVFDRLDVTPPGRGGEIQLTDALATLVDGPGLVGVVVASGSYDAGQRLDWLRANVELALADPDGGGEVAAMVAAALDRARPTPDPRPGGAR